MQLDIDRVVTATEKIPQEFLGTPQYRSEPLSRLLGIDVILKVETANPSGTVASRWAEWWFENNSEVHRVVCPSSGDFGVAMSLAGRARGREVELFGPIDADAAKVEELRHSGTIVRLDGRTTREALEEATRYASMVDGLLIEDGTAIEFIEGAATLVAELETLSHPPDAIFVPIGRGSLALGTALYAHERMPRTRVVGVGAESAPGPVRSVRERRLVSSEVVGSATPEMGVSAPAPELVAALGAAIDDTSLVSDRHLQQAATALLVNEGLRASLDGAAALAAAALAAPSMRGATVVVPVTGRAVG